MPALMWSAEGSATMNASNGRSSEAPAERWLGMVGGIAFGVLTFIGWAFWAGPHLPELNAPSVRIGAWYAAHQGAARAGVLCGVLALLPFMGFVVALYQRLRAAEGGGGTLSLLTLLGGVLVSVVH